MAGHKVSFILSNAIIVIIAHTENRSKGLYSTEGIIIIIVIIIIMIIPEGILLTI